MMFLKHPHIHNKEPITSEELSKKFNKQHKKGTSERQQQQRPATFYVNEIHDADITEYPRSKFFVNANSTSSNDTSNHTIQNTNTNNHDINSNTTVTSNITNNSNTNIKNNSSNTDTNTSTNSIANISTTNTSSFPGNASINNQSFPGNALINNQSDIRKVTEVLGNFDSKSTAEENPPHPPVKMITILAANDISSRITNQTLLNMMDSTSISPRTHKLDSNSQQSASQKGSIISETPKTENQATSSPSTANDETTLQPEKSSLSNASIKDPLDHFTEKILQHIEQEQHKNSNNSSRNSEQNQNREQQQTTDSPITSTNQSTTPPNNIISTAERISKQESLDNSSLTSSDSSPLRRSDSTPKSDYSYLNIRNAQGPADDDEQRHIKPKFVSNRQPNKEKKNNNSIKQKLLKSLQEDENADPDSSGNDLDSKEFIAELAAAKQKVAVKDIGKGFYIMEEENDKDDEQDSNDVEPDDEEEEKDDEQDQNEGMKKQNDEENVMKHENSTMTKKKKEVRTILSLFEIIQLLFLLFYHTH